MSGQNKELTTQEETFVSAYIRHGLKDGGAAAIEAGYSAHTAITQASRLLKRPKIKARIDEARATLKSDTDFNTKQYTRDLATMRDDAKKDGVHGAAVKAMELIGRVHGVYVEKHQDVSADMADLKRDLTDDVGYVAEGIINHIFDGKPADDNTIRELVLKLGRAETESVG